jgi:hypothetical protein
LSYTNVNKGWTSSLLLFGKRNFESSFFLIQEMKIIHKQAEEFQFGMCFQLKYQKASGRQKILNSAFDFKLAEAYF